MYFINIERYPIDTELSFAQLYYFSDRHINLGIHQDNHRKHLLFFKHLYLGNAEEISIQDMYIILLLQSLIILLDVFFIYPIPKIVNNYFRSAFKSLLLNYLRRKRIEKPCRKEKLKALLYMFVTMRNENIESICRGTLGIAKFSKNLNNAHNCFHFNYIIYNTFSKTGTGNFDDTIIDHKQHNIHSRIIKLSSKTVNTIICLQNSWDD